MIDFHTHILPCMDDGSQSVSESISMLQTLARQGIDTVVLSPHFYAQENSPAAFLERRERAWQQLQPQLSPELPQVRLGAEVQYFEGICAVEDIQKLRIAGTDYLLLEMPFSRWTQRMVGDILTLNDRTDTTVVLAHVERYLAMQPKAVWNQLHTCGVLTQVNVSFFKKWKTRHTAMSMLTKGKIHLLGSDCHNMTTRQPNWNLLPQKARMLAEQSPAYTAFPALVP